MPTTSSAEARAEQRRSGTRTRRRADSPVALAAWGLVAALLTYGQLQRGVDELPDATVDLPADVSAEGPAMPSPVDGAPVAPPAFLAAAAPPLAPSIAAPLAPWPVLSAPGNPAVVAAPAPAAPRVAEAPPAAPKAAKEKPAPARPKRPFEAFAHPKVAFASPLLTPRLHLPRVLEPRLTALKGLLARARPGEPVAVRLSAYCLRGSTRTGGEARTGIVAGDPRVFPLGRHVELYAAGRYLGRYLVDDTGHHIKGARIDIWTPDCDDARRFGTREGVAALVAVGG